MDNSSIYTIAITKTVTFLLYTTNMFSSTKGIRLFLWFTSCRPRQGLTSSPLIYSTTWTNSTGHFSFHFPFYWGVRFLFFIRPFEWHPFQRPSAKFTYILQVVSYKCILYLRFISQSVSLLECTSVMVYLHQLNVRSTHPKNVFQLSSTSISSYLIRFWGLCFPSVTILWDLYTTFYTIQFWSFYWVFTFYLLQLHSYFFVSISALTIVVFPMSITVPSLPAPRGTSFKRRE